MSADATLLVVQNFWVPVGQIVPVFALALVIEARRLAQTWKKSGRFYRRFESTVLALAAFCLALIETAALNSMADNTSSEIEVLLTRIALPIVIAGIALSPVSNIATAANADVVALLLKRLPWSPENRMRHDIHELEVDATNLLVGVTSNLVERTEQKIEIARQLRELRAYLPSLRELTSNPPLILSIEHVVEMRNLQAEVAGQIDVLGRTLAVTRSYTRDQRRREKDTLRFLRRIQRLKATTSTRDLSPTERRGARAMLEFYQAKP